MSWEPVADRLRDRIRSAAREPSRSAVNAPQSNDLFVDTDGRIYMTDRYGGGLHIIEYRP